MAISSTLGYAGMTLGSIDLGDNVGGGMPGGITGLATIPSTAAIITGGTVTAGLKLVGAAPVPSGKAINTGTGAAVGLYTITERLTSILGYMDLGTLQPAQVMQGTSPLDIFGAFTYVPASTARVPTGGIVRTALTLTGTATVPTSASVKLGGIVNKIAGKVLIGSSPVISGPVVYTGGVVRDGYKLIGSVVTGAGAVVFGGGAIHLLAPQFQSIETTNYWAGHSNPYVLSVRPNEFDEELRAQAEQQEMVLRAISEWSRGLQSEQRGMGALGTLGADPVGASRGPGVNCFKVNLRKNFFERGKLLTPADSGATLHPVVQFTVPIGYQCALLGYYANYTGTGFVPGSGDLAWRLKAGNAWVRNLGNLLYAVGSLTNTFSMPAPVMLDSGMSVSFSIQAYNTSGLIQVGASYILCGLQGWLYPTPQIGGLPWKEGTS